MDNRISCFDNLKIIQIIYKAVIIMISLFPLLFTEQTIHGRI